MQLILILIVAWMLLKKNVVATGVQTSDYSTDGDTPNPLGQPTISGQKASNLADQLYEDLDSYLGADQKNVEDILMEVHTEANYALVAQKFGRRSYHSGLIQIGGGTDMTMDEMIMQVYNQFNWETFYIKSAFPNIF